MPPSAPNRAHHVSIAVILLLWARDLYTNLFDLELVMSLAGSLPRLALAASAYGLFIVLVVVGLLRWSGEGLRDVGFTSHRVARQLAVGFAFGIGLFVFQQVLSPAIDALLPAGSAQGVDLAPLFGDVRQYPIWFLLAVFKGGFQEELWRVFILTRFERVLGRPGLVLAIALSSAIFGIEHLYQGVDTAIGTGIQAVLFVMIYLRRRRALEAVTAHAVYDLVAITLAYVVL